MHFTKMHGLGNDYLCVYGEVPENAEELSQALCNRHFGAGAEGIIYISLSKIADFKMCLFAPDGSKAKAGVTTVACVGKYVYDKGYTDKTQLKIETLSGVKALDLNVSNGTVKTVSAEMGRAEVSDDLKLNIDGVGVKLTVVPVADNRYAVSFVRNVEKTPLLSLGEKIKGHSAFADGVSVVPVQLLDERTLRVRLPNASASDLTECAVAGVASAIKHGYCTFNEAVSVLLEVGTAKIMITSDLFVSVISQPEIVYEGRLPGDCDE